MRLAALLLGAFVAASFLPAQEVRATAMAARWAGAERGSLAWFEHGCELVEAQLDIDARTALSTAQVMWQAAADRAPIGAMPACASIVGLVYAILDGPIAAEPWVQRAPDMPAAAAASLRAHFYLARARILCFQGSHAEELAFSVPGQIAADESKDPVLRVRAMALTAHITPERSLTKLNRLFAEVDAAGHAADVEHLRHLLLVQEFNIASSQENGEDAERIAAQVEAVAVAQGNRRLLATVTVTKANVLYKSDQRDEAQRLYGRVVEMFEQLADRRELFGVMNMQTWAAMHREDLDAAEAQIAKNRELLEGRGFVPYEKELLRSRFELAVRRRDGDQAAELKRAFDDFDSTSSDLARRADSLRERLRAVEEQKLAMEDRLRGEQERALESARSTRTIAGVGLVVLLMLLVAIGWRSRRRLVAANSQLAEQVRRVEEGLHIQARLEERMRELERTESLGTMAAGVAHDFNNLLTSIMGSAELLHRPCASGEIGELANTILVAGEQAARLCRQLQAYSGGTPTVCVPLDLGALAREMLPALQAATKGAVSVRVQTPGLPVGTLGDRAQIEQVLLNLVMNAIDAHAKSVTIALADVGPRPILVGSDTQVEDRVVAMTVTDDGDGMSSEVQQRIFDPFFTTRFPGRGLGLAVVHGVVRRHQGRVAVESAPGRGAKFIIQLPSAKAPESLVEIPRAIRPERALLADALVVVIDDDISVREMLRRMLSLIGYDARILDRAEAVAPLVGAEPPARRVVVFVDLTMPDIDGVEVVRRVRAVRPSARIVLMSGHPASYVDQVAGQVVPDRVLSKPFTLEALRGLLFALVETAPPKAPPKAAANAPTNATNATNPSTT